MSRMKRHADQGFPDRIFNDFYYHSGKKVFDENNVLIRTYFTCPIKRCRGSGKLEGDVFSSIVGHEGHSADPLLEAKYAVDRQLYITTITSLEEIQIIYNDFIALHHEITIDWDAKEQCSRMAEWRRRAELPDLENSFSKFHSILNTEKWRSLRLCAEDFLNVEILDDEGIMFSHPKVLQRLSRSKTLIINVTTSPHPLLLPIGEMMTVMVVEHPENNPNRTNRRVIPCIWFGFRNKSQRSLQFVKEKISETFSEAQILLSNWDAQLDSSLREKYSNVKGTYFSYGTIICQRTHEFSIDLHDEVNLDFIRGLIALALLPADAIVESFRKLITIENHAVRTLIDYFQNIWINSIGPEKMSYFDDKIALADCQRQYDLLVKSEFGKKQPTMFQFMRFIIDLTRKVLEDMNKEKGKVSKFCLLLVPDIDTKRIQNIWTELKTGHVNGLRAFEKLAGQTSLRTYINKIIDFPQLLPNDYCETLEAATNAIEGVNTVNDRIFEVPEDDFGYLEARSEIVDFLPIGTAKELDETLDEVRKQKNCNVAHALCTVCNTDVVDRLIDGCGHLFCNNCIQFMERCPICRGALEKTHDAYFV